MFVKKIELLGFKSFADKTEVQLNDGLTAVVGPNGCGKSNIADALQWVLGESNVRNIRGQRSTDVIFSGSEKRKSHGMAEVSLTLDNTCGTLPLSFSEVTVTRRAFRSGEAEYFINKSRCRLKDIYELFLDTGIGREAYSVITQGEIDAVLSAKPEDRRELIEEAAGVKKYRYRREEALKKLDRTEANLHRVRDIMAEIGGQLEPLAEQAEQAKKFNELQSRLRTIEVGLLIRDLCRFTESLEEARGSKEGAAEKIAELDRRISDLEWEKEKQNDSLQELEQEVENARKVHQSISANVQRLEGKSAVIDERLRSADSVRAQANDDISALERKIQDIRERIERLELEESECAKTEARAKSEVEARAKSLAELDARHAESSRVVDEQKASYLELAKELAAKRNALQNARERSGQIESALSKYAQEIESLETQKREAENRRAETVKEIAKLEARVSKSSARAEELDRERDSAERTSAELDRGLAETARDAAGKSSRLGTLREMAEAHEGFFEGVRSVTAARKSGRLAGGFAVVADVISVPKGHEIAIETALGANLQDIIADTLDDAKHAIAFLKETRTGRATFLPLDNMRPSTTQVRGKMDPRSGALGIAADLIGYDAKYDPAIRALLARTVVAENIDSAVALSKQLDGWNKIVTLEGELIVPSGAITGGSMKSKGPGLLVRKQEIESLTGEIAELERAASGLQDERETVKSRLEELRSETDSTGKSLSEDKIALAEQQRRLDFAGKDFERIARQLETVALERDETLLLRDDEVASASRLEAELKTAGKENTDLDLRVAGAERDIEEITKGRAREREALMSLNVELAGATERTAALRNTRKEALASLDELSTALASRNAQVDGLSGNSAALVEERESVVRELAHQREIFGAAERTLSDLIEKRANRVEAAASVDRQLRETAAQRNSLAQETHDADVREARLEVQVQQASERLLEEYEVTVEQALEWPEEIEIERGTASEVARLRREIKDMGPVNTGAVAEYDRIKERWDFLTEQRADLESAREQISSAIAEIDANTRGLFMETFTSVAANFEVMFKRLFGGGRAELSLTDPNDLLETGIAVTVQPPGKKLQDMALLSGGERALTATALVFALLMAKPSPFVVMDEVDAPLDEGNVERFAEVLKEFAANSQFIVVTHNRATMEAADSLYGVTMQEPGVSKLISVKLTGEGPVEREAPSEGEKVLVTSYE